MKKLVIFLTIVVSLLVLFIAGYLFENSTPYTTTSEVMTGIVADKIGYINYHTEGEKIRTTYEKYKVTFTDGTSYFIPEDQFTLLRNGMEVEYVVVTETTRILGRSSAHIELLSDALTAPNVGFNFQTPPQGFDPNMAPPQGFDPNMTTQGNYQAPPQNFNQNPEVQFTSN